MTNSNEIIRQHVVNMVEILKNRVRQEIPVSGQFDKISVKVNQSIPDGYIKEMRLDVFQGSGENISMDAAIFDIEDSNQYIPLTGGTKEEIVAYLNEDNIVEILTDGFKTLFKYAMD